MPKAVNGQTERKKNDIHLSKQYYTCFSHERQHKKEKRKKKDQAHIQPLSQLYEEKRTRVHN